MFGWAAGEHNIFFYEYDNFIVRHNPIWVRVILIVVVSMFESVVLLTNIGETKSIFCTPVFIWVQQGTVVYKSRVTVEGYRFRKRGKIG